MMITMLKYKVGHAWIYDNLVIYGDFSDVLSLLRGHGRRKAGSFLGVVKAVIPVDPYRVLYEYLKHSPAYIQRQKVRKHRKKLGITMKELTAIQKLTKWIRRKSKN